MGLNFSEFELLNATKCIEKIKLSNEGNCSVLMLGRAKVSLGSRQIKFSSEKYNCPIENFSGYAERLLSFMGCSSINSLDYSEFEECSLTWNLNSSMSKAGSKTDELNKYDLILDLGTSEHCFLPAQSVANSLAMLKIGGMLNLMSPVCGQVDHGLYQFSPNFFYAIDSDVVELVRLYFCVNQQNSINLEFWDGMDERFRSHVSGTFDGSYQANLLQYIQKPIYAFALFRKKAEIDEEKFLCETHQLVYSAKWKEHLLKQSAERTNEKKVLIFLEQKLPIILKNIVYKRLISSYAANIETISAI